VRALRGKLAIPALTVTASSGRAAATVLSFITTMRAIV